jgi:ribosomal protein S18 acetylase RimI-like enzyme
MKAICLHSKKEIEEFLRRNTFLHLYSIGDLDNFFWQYTTWYALIDNRDDPGHQKITQLALMYSGIPLPTLLALTEEPAEDLYSLLQSIMPLLPKRFYAHLSGDIATAFANNYLTHSHGKHFKMALLNKARLDSVDVSNVVPLSVADLPEIADLYRVSYPENSFDPRMLETGCYYGIRNGRDLVSIAGIHVYSPRYKVAALGNITTHPDFRGQRLGTAVCAKLCQELLRTVDDIGLNVKASNASAISCYERLGFEQIATYEEYTFELR